MIEREVLTTSCENSEPSPNIAAAQEINGNAKLIEGESSLDVLNFSAILAMIEQIFVKPSLDFPLSQNVLFDVLCDKDDLHDDITMPPMMNDHTICSLESNTYAENKYVIYNASDIDEPQLLSF